jgi:hypothetical protein
VGQKKFDRRMPPLLKSHDFPLEFINLMDWIIPDDELSLPSIVHCTWKRQNLMAVLIRGPLLAHSPNP